MNLYEDPGHIQIPEKIIEILIMLNASVRCIAHNNVAGSTAPNEGLTSNGD